MVSAVRRCPKCGSILFNDTDECPHCMGIDTKGSQEYLPPPDFQAPPVHESDEGIFWLHWVMLSLGSFSFLVWIGTLACSTGGTAPSPSLILVAILIWPAFFLSIFVVSVSLLLCLRDVDGKWAFGLSALLSLPLLFYVFLHL